MLTCVVVMRKNAYYAACAPETRSEELRKFGFGLSHLQESHSKKVVRPPFGAFFPVFPFSGNSKQLFRAVTDRLSARVCLCVLPMNIDCGWDSKG